jgi:hypothetical protein
MPENLNQLSIQNHIFSILRQSVKFTAYQISSLLKKTSYLKDQIHKNKN